MNLLKIILNRKDFPFMEVSPVKFKRIKKRHEFPIVKKTLKKNYTEAVFDFI